MTYNMSEQATLTAFRVIPVAGRDGMLMNLSGAHAPFFTRNLLLLTDNAGRTGIADVPGGEAIRQTLEEAATLLIGQPVDGQFLTEQPLQIIGGAVAVPTVPGLGVTLDMAARRAGPCALSATGSRRAQ